MTPTHTIRAEYARDWGVVMVDTLTKETHA